MRISSLLCGLALFAGTAGAQNASVSVIHGIPGLSSAVEVFANGNKLFSFNYGESKALSLPPAKYDLEARLNGNPVLSGSATVMAGKSYSIIAHLQESTGIKLSIYENSLMPAKKGDARVIVRHTAKAPAVDVAVDLNNSRFATLKNLKNPGEVMADIPADVYEASLFAAGTTTRAFGPAKLDLKAAMGYAVYAIGELGQQSFRLFIETFNVPVQPDADVTVIHGIPGINTPVDVFADGNKLFSFSYGESKQLMLPEGSYNLEVRQGSTSLLSGTAQVMSGKNYSVIAHLKEQTGAMLSVFENDSMPVNPGAARLIVRHTARAPAVDVSLDQFNRRLGLIEDLKNPGSAMLEVPAGNYESSIFVANTTNLAFGPAKLDLSAGMSYVVFAIGEAGQTSFRLFVQAYQVAQLPAIDTAIMGQACAGQMWISNPVPAYGEEFDISLFNGVSNDVAVLAIGVTPLSVSLPANCMLYTDPVSLVPVRTDLSGRASLEVVVPRSLGNMLPDVYLQWGFPATAHGLDLRTTQYLKISN